VTDRDKSKEELVQRARSLTARAAAALAALAIAPAAASAAPGTATDDTVAEFMAGTNAGTEVVDPGTVQLVRNGAREDFEGTTLPTGWSSFTWDPAGTAAVSGGRLTVDGAGARIDATSTTPQVLEFQATFGTDDFQHVGFAAGSGSGEDFKGQPWAMFSTGGAAQGPGLYARTATTAAVQDEPTEPIGGVDPTQPHVYRIERTETEIRYFVDGALVRTATGAVVPAADLRPVASDFTLGGATVSVDWLQLYTYGTGSFESRVLDSGKAATDWTTLTAAGTGDVTFETRSGETAAPDVTWSDWAAVSGGDIASPSSRYIQYRATLSSGAGGTTTPTIDSVSIAYNTDDEAPAATIGGVQVTGATARVTFSSTAGDVARFECSLDGGAFATCASPREFTGLSAGAHTIAVRAIDRAGNAGTAVAQGFTVAAATNTSPPSFDSTAPKVRPRPRTVYVSNKGRFKVSVRCPSNETSCRIVLRIRYRGKTVASTAVTVRGGTSKTLVLRLKPAARTAVRSRGRLRVTAVTTARDAAGNRATTQTRLRLRD
jgi:hypothetical protein